MAVNDTPAILIAAPVIQIAGVSIPFPDVIAAVRVGGWLPRRQVEAKDRPLFGWRVENLRPFDESQLLKLCDHIIALALFEARGGSQFRHGSEAFELANGVSCLE